MKTEKNVTVSATFLSANGPYFCQVFGFLGKSLFMPPPGWGGAFQPEYLPLSHVYRLRSLLKITLFTFYRNLLEKQNNFCAVVGNAMARRLNFATSYSAWINRRVFHLKHWEPSNVPSQFISVQCFDFKRPNVIPASWWWLLSFSDFKFHKFLENTPLRNSVIMTLDSLKQVLRNVPM